MEKKLIADIAAYIDVRLIEQCTQGNIAARDHVTHVCLSEKYGKSVLVVGNHRNKDPFRNGYQDEEMIIPRVVTQGRYIDWCYYIEEYILGEPLGRGNCGRAMPIEDIREEAVIRVLTRLRDELNKRIDEIAPTKKIRVLRWSSEPHENIEACVYSGSLTRNEYNFFAKNIAPHVLVCRPEISHNNMTMNKLIMTSTGQIGVVGLGNVHESILGTDLAHLCIHQCRNLGEYSLDRPNDIVEYINKLYRRVYDKTIKKCKDQDILFLCFAFAMMYAISKELSQIDVIGEKMGRRTRSIPDWKNRYINFLKELLTEYQNEFIIKEATQSVDLTMPE